MVLVDGHNMVSTPDFFQKLWSRISSCCLTSTMPKSSSKSLSVQSRSTKRRDQVLASWPNSTQVAKTTSKPQILVTRAMSFSDQTKMVPSAKFSEARISNILSTFLINVVQVQNCLMTLRITSMRFKIMMLLWWHQMESSTTSTTSIPMLVSKPMWREVTWSVLKLLQIVLRIRLLSLATRRTTCLHSPSMHKRPISTSQRWVRLMTSWPLLHKFILEEVGLRDQRILPFRQMAWD